MAEKKLSQDEKDLRIERASAVSKVLKERGIKILQEEWEKIREKAFQDLTNEGLASEELRAAQMVYNQICEWIEIPNNIIKEGQDVGQESERSPMRIIKKAVPFLDRRY